MKASPPQKQFNNDYFSRYQQKNIFGNPKGERAFFYDYWMRFLSQRINKGAKVLEVGCGLGYFSRKLSEHYLTCSVDLSFEALSYAKKGMQNGFVMQSDAEKIPVKENSMDCVISFDLIEHLPIPENFLDQIKGILKKDGILILGTPNPESLGRVFKKGRHGYAGKPWEERIFEWHGWRDKTHINIREIKEWRKLVNKMGFRVLRDGTDFLWDAPYVPYIPLLLQKVVFNGSHRLLTSMFGFLPWRRGENYYMVANKIK